MFNSAAYLSELKWEKSSSHPALWHSWTGTVLHSWAVLSSIFSFFLPSFLQNPFTWSNWVFWWTLVVKDCLWIKTTIFMPDSPFSDHCCAFREKFSCVVLPLCFKGAQIYVISSLSQMGFILDSHNRERERESSSWQLNTIPCGPTCHTIYDAKYTDNEHCNIVLGRPRNTFWFVKLQNNVSKINPIAIL